MCRVKKQTYFPFIYDYYKTAYALSLYIALNFILIERSEVKLRLFYKIRYMEEKFRKSRLKLKFRFQNKYSVFLRKFVLRNYVIISLQCFAYIRR